MDESVMIAYAEVEQIINLMDEQFQKMIPTELRKLISENKSTKCNTIIDKNVPLNEQKISKKALAILAVLNYNYWCINEEEKNILIKQYKNNEVKKQKELEEKYNIDVMFKNKSKNTYNKNENMQIILYNKKDNFIKKIINKLKKILKNN